MKATKAGKGQRNPSGTTSTIQIWAEQRGYTLGHPCPARLCQKTGGCSRALAPKEAQGSGAGFPGTSSTWNKQGQHQHVSERLIRFPHLQLQARHPGAQMQSCLNSSSSSSFPAKKTDSLGTRTTVSAQPTHCPAAGPPVVKSLHYGHWGKVRSLRELSVLTS